MTPWRTASRPTVGTRQAAAGATQMDRCRERPQGHVKEDGAKWRCGSDGRAEGPVTVLHKPLFLSAAGRQILMVQLILVSGTRVGLRICNF